MIVEVKGVSSANQGAHLMLLALQEGMAPYWEATYAMNLRSWRNFNASYRGGYEPVAHITAGAMVGLVQQINRLLRAVPGPVLRIAGGISPRSVSCLLDASGFSYSDQLSLGNMESTGRYYQWLADRGVPVVLLPQAFGPFRSERSKELIRRIVESAALIYCRDEESYRHLAGACHFERDKVKVAPDFTLGLRPPASAELSDALDDHVVLIPNMRMVDKTDARIGDAYWRFLTTSLDELDNRGVPVHVVVQGEPKDLVLADRIQRHARSMIVMTSTDDPLETKRIVGAARAVISSRFHGAINALSYGRPVLVTSWSHKYEQLMSAFGLGDFVADLQAGEEDWRQSVSNLLDASDSDAATKRLLSVKDEWVGRSEEMWREIANLTGSIKASSSN